MKPFLVITGMHRSGTSFLVRALNLAGVNLGDIEDLNTTDWAYLKDNLRGHWENKEFLRLAEKTLALNKGSWDNLPRNVIITEKIGKSVKELSEKLVDKPSFAAGIKDPRILILLDSWIPYLPKNLIIVGIFRNPLKVAESLKKRNNFSYEKSLQLWKTYNQKLVDFLEKYDGFLIDFDWPKTKLFSEINLLLKKLGIPKFDFSEWYTEELLHSDTTYDSSYQIPQDSDILYSRLKERSLINDKVLFKTDPQTSEDLLKIITSLLSDIKRQGSYFKKLNDEHLDELANLRVSLNQATKNPSVLNPKLKNRDATINLLKSELKERYDTINQLASELKNRDATINKMISDAKVLQRDIEDYQSAIKDYQRYILDIHQSFVFKMLRKYDNSIGKLIPLRTKKYLKSSKEESTVTEHQSIIQTILSESKLEKKDVLCFPIINWDYRYQRPHHFSRKFAESGHRVFYFTVNLRPLEKQYEIKKLQKNIYQIELKVPRYFDIYKDELNESFLEFLIDSFKKARKDLKIDAFSIVMFPTWYPLALKLRELFGYKIIFDCLDDFASFPNVHKKREVEQEKLFQQSDLISASSNHLFENASKISSKVLYLPNACEFELFNARSTQNVLQNYPKPIIGYFGSIAEWFDTELVEFIARQRTNLTFILIGHTYGSDISKLDKLNNVHFLGERPYHELPKYLHEFDVCIIPFKNSPLIDATHPIKIYEYFAAGKPVVATNMKSLNSMKDLCYIAEGKEDFLQKIDLALQENNSKIVQQRIDYSSKNTWEHRFDKLLAELQKIKSLNINSHNYNDYYI